MPNYNADLLRFSKEFNQAKRDLDQKRIKMESDRTLNKDYVREEIQRLDTELKAKYQKKIEDLTASINKTKGETYKKISSAKFPGLANGNTLAYEQAYANAKALIGSNPMPDKILAEAQQALEMGRVDFGFILR